MKIQAAVGVCVVASLILFLASCPATDDDDQQDDDAQQDDDFSPDCVDVEPLNVGIYHRETAEACPVVREPLVSAPSSCGSTEDDECAAHEDCTAGFNGRCFLAQDSGLCSCAYDECFSDLECSPTSLCRCAEQYPFELNTNNACIRAACRTDADCETGLCFGTPFFCGAAAEGETMYIARFACADPNDECRNHETCYCDGSPQRCHPNDDGAWVCSNNYMATCE